MNKHERDVRKLLKRSGVPYDIVRGTKHDKLYVNGSMVLVLQFCNNSGRSSDLRQIRSIIERAKNDN